MTSDRFENTMHDWLAERGAGRAPGRLHVDAMTVIGARRQRVGWWASLRAGVTGAPTIPGTWMSSTIRPIAVVLLALVLGVALGYAGANRPGVLSTPTQSLQPTPANSDPPAPSGAWSPKGRMHEDRVDTSTATLLADGTVLVVGGENGTAEIYNPATGEFSETASMAVGRQQPSATLLDDGRVLVAGGFDGHAGLATAELYDPESQSWTATGAMHDGRFGHTATLLGDGHVLVVAGSSTETDYLATSEIYDPALGTWSPAGSIVDARSTHNAVLLADGRVLVVGGSNADQAVASAEVFDPGLGSWTQVDSMASARSYASAAQLPDGAVLVAGGGFGGTHLQSAELFDPIAGTWSAAGEMTEPRAQHVGVELPDGRMLVAGGGQSENPTAEIYDQLTDSWSPTGPMTTWRASPMIVLLNNGTVLLAGGFADDAASTEVFDPFGGGPVATAPPWITRCLEGCQGPITGEGRFESASFIQGLQMTLPGGTWFNTADNQNEIQFEAGGSTIRFWQTARAASGTGELLSDVPGTVQGLTDWFVSNPDLDVSEPEQVTIGEGIAATTFSFDVSPTNVNDDPECPVSSCMEVLWIGEHRTFGIGIGSGERLYLFNYGTGNDARTIVVSLDTPKSSLVGMTTKLDAMLQTLRLP